MSPLSHEEVQENAGGLAALPHGDPERDAAYAHARTCESCRRLLSQGEALQRILGRVELSAPAPEALHRASAQILADLRPGRASHALPAAGERSRAGERSIHRTKPTAALLPALAAAAGFALLLAFNRHPFHPGFAGDSMLFALAGVACAALSLTPLRAWALPTALFASGALVFANAAPGPALAAVGERCLLAEVASGMLSLAVAAVLALRGRASGGALVFAGAAAGGALAGQAALQLTCPASSVGEHLAAFHFTGVVAAALVGALLSRAPPLRPAAV